MYFLFISRTSSIFQICFVLVAWLGNDISGNVPTNFQDHFRNDPGNGQEIFWENSEKTLEHFLTFRTMSMKCPGIVQGMSGECLGHVQEKSRKCPEKFLDMSGQLKDLKPTVEAN